MNNDEAPPLLCSRCNSLVEIATWATEEHVCFEQPTNALLFSTVKSWAGSDQVSSLATSCRAAEKGLRNWLETADFGHVPKHVGKNTIEAARLLTPSSGRKRPRKAQQQKRPQTTPTTQSRGSSEDPVDDDKDGSGSDDILGFKRHLPTARTGHRAAQATPESSELSSTSSSSDSSSDSLSDTSDTSHSDDATVSDSESGVSSSDSSFSDEQETSHGKDPERRVRHNHRKKNILADSDVDELPKSTPVKKSRPHKFVMR